LDSLFSRQQLTTLVFPRHCLACEAELLDQADHTIPRQIADQRLASQPRDTASLDNQTLDAQTLDNQPRNNTTFLQWQHDHWCLDCWQRLTRRPSNACKKCGAYLARPNPFGDRCSLCHGQVLHFDAALATGNYQNLLQELIVQMKNSHDETIAHQLGVLLGYELLNAGWDGYDQIIAVPTHWWRKLKRGFLAAEIIAESVSHIAGLKHSTRTLRAIRPTKKQGTLSNQARVANVRGAFEVLPNSNLKDARVLIIDDVMTSGATTSEIARILKKAGASNVSVAVVARGARVS